MTILQRTNVVNATEVDSMIGTTNWTVIGEGSFGKLSFVQLRWIEGTYKGFPLCKWASVFFIEVTKGKNPDDIREAKEREEGEYPSGYSRNTIGHHELFTIDLTFSIEFIKETCILVRAPRDVPCEFSKKQLCVSNFNHDYYFK